MSQDEHVFRVGDDSARLTLSAALRLWLPGKPAWSHVQQLIRTRRVQVNGNLCQDEARRLKPGEVIKVLANPVAPPAREDDVKLRYLDAHLVVVEKPSGMTSVRHHEEQDWSPQRRRNNPTLEDVLPRILAKRQSKPPAKRTSGQKPGSMRMPPVRPVHRLDRETSGLMVFARSIPAERELGQQFRQHTTERTYLAIVLGQVGPQTISSRLVRDRGDGRRGSTTSPTLGKEAVTHIRPIESLGNYTLIECQLETGRTHQIRIHLSELGHPVCGEKVYLHPLHAPPLVDPSGAPRLALHAAELGFKHPITGERHHYSMPLPKDLAKLLTRLRSDMSPRR